MKPSENQSFDNHLTRCIEHYDHAKENHPYFCDMITCLSETGADTHLELARGLLATEIDTRNVEVKDVLMCEFYDAIQAHLSGDNADAVEKLYDTIAVCLRAIDVLEGRQNLGRPEKK